MTAIVTDVHYRMSAALIRDLSDAGVRVIACEYADYKDPVGFYCRGAAEKKVLSAHDGICQLYELCAEEYRATGSKPALMPVGAKTLEAVSRDRESCKEVCGMAVPDTEQLELFNDKSAVSDLAQRLGIGVAKQYSLEDDFEYPVVVKPVCGEKAGLEAAKRYVIAYNRETLERAFDRFYTLTKQPPLICEYLSGHGAGCSVMAVGGQIKAHICHRRVREYPVTGGPSSCCEKIESEELVEYASLMTERTGYTGVAMFEFKADSRGRYRLLEVNPRVWGTYPLTRVCGSNFSYIWYLASLGLPVCDFKGGKPVRMVYYPSDFAAMLGYLKRAQPSEFFAGLADFLNPRVKNGLSEKGDRAPYRAYIRSLLKRGLK